MPPSTDPTPNVDTAVDDRDGQLAVDDRPDDFFAVVAGLYAALLVAPLVTAASARTVGDPAILYLTLLAGLATVTTATALAVRRQHGLPERLGSTRGRWLPAVVAPVAVAVAGLVLSAGGGVTSVDGILGVVAGAGGLGGGVVLAIMSRSRYTKAVTAASEQFATWRAGWSDRRRRPVQALGGLAIVAGIAGFVALFVWHSDLLRTAVNLLVPAGAIATTVGQPRTYVATAAGLEERMPAARKLVDWDRFDGFTVESDAVVLHRHAPWRLPVIFAREDLDDEAAVLAALEESLPRLPADA